jgi:hypothetical protein
MPAAAAAMFLGPDHSERQVAAVLDRVGQCLIEAGPAGAAVIFGGRVEQRQVAAGAGEDTLAMFLEQGAGESTFGARLAQDPVACRSKPAKPVVRAAPDFKIRSGGTSAGQDANRCGCRCTRQAKKGAAVRS